MNTLSIQRNGLSFKVIRSQHESFWQDVNQEIWEPETFKVFDRYLSPETTYLDIGAWIGPTLLYAAQKALTAIAFEPDPVAYQELAANAQLNPDINNIRVYEALIGSQNGKTRLGSRREGGDSMSSVLFAEQSTSWLVDSICLPDFVAQQNLQPPFFIKMDIEGGEYALLPTLASFWPQAQPIVLYLSLHPQFLLIDSSSSQQPLRSLAGWVRLIQAHWILANSLSTFKYIYDVYGNRVSVWHGLLKALWNRTPIAENAIVATNQPWE